MNSFDSRLSSEFVQSLLSTWPHPLPALLRQYWLSRLDEDGQPTRLPNMAELLDFSGTLIRFVSLMAIIQYLRLEQSHPDSDLNRRLLDALSAPADGTWRALGQQAAEVLGQSALRESRGSFVGPFIPEFIPGVSPAKDAQARWRKCQELVTYRNSYYYRPQEALTPQSRIQAVQVLEDLVRDLSSLAQLQLVVRIAAVDAYVFRGLIENALQRVPAPVPELPLYHPCFVADDGTVLDAWPFLVYVDARDVPAVELSELLYYSRASARSLDFLAYRRSARHRSTLLGEIGKSSYEDFSRLMLELAQRAAPESIPPPGFNDEPLLERHLKHFVGRQQELKAVLRWVLETPSGFGAATGRAGSGKSALMCRLRVLAADLVRRPNSPLRNTCFAWHHCLRQEGRDHQVLILRSLCRQVEEMLGDQLQLSFAEPLAKLSDLRLLRSRLDHALSQLGKHNSAAADPIKLVIVLDGLDEIVPFTGAEDELLKAFPEELPPGVLVLVSYRIDESGMPLVQLGRKTGRVQPCLERPLGPLDEHAVRELLNRLLAGGEEQVSPALVTGLWQRSQGEPLYFVLLAEAIERGELALSDLKDAPLGFESFVRRRIWADLPGADNYAAHRLLALVSVVRGGCTDTLAQSVLGLGDTAVAEARSYLGTFLNVSASGDLEPRYSLYHDRVREAVQRQFTAEEIAACLGTLIQYLEGQLDAVDMNAPDARRAWADLTHYRFERGRLLADFHELFASYDAGFLDAKLARLHNPALLAEDFDILLRACMMANDQPRAFRLVLERSTLASEAGWLSTRGMPGLLTRLAPLISSEALDGVLGMLELIPGDASRVSAYIDVANSLPDADQASRVLGKALRLMDDSGASSQWSSAIGNLAGLVAARFPEHREKTRELLQRHYAPRLTNAGPDTTSLLDRLMGGVLLEGTPLEPSPQDAAAAEPLAQALAPWLVHWRCPELFGDVLEVLHDTSGGVRGQPRNATANRLGLLLEPLLWSPLTDELRPLAPVLEDFLERSQTISCEARLLLARFHASRGDWERCVESLKTATLAASRGENPGQLARVGKAMCELDRPGAPLQSFRMTLEQPDQVAVAGFDAGLRLLSIARRMRWDKADVDLRGKRRFLPLVKMSGLETMSGGLAEVDAFQAAANAHLAVEKDALQYFRSGAERLSRESYNEWDRDLPAMFRATLCFPTEQARAARLFDLFAAIEDAGLDASSQGDLSRSLLQLLPEMGYALAPEFERPVLHRLTELARSLSVEHAKAALLIAIAGRLWDTGEAEESLRLTRELCIGLAYGDRLSGGLAGYGAVSKLCPGATSRQKLLDVLCTMAEADPGHAEIGPLLSAFGRVLLDHSPREGGDALLERAVSLAHLVAIDRIEVDFLSDLTRTLLTQRGQVEAQRFLLRVIERLQRQGQEASNSQLVPLVLLAAELNLDTSLEALVRLPQGYSDVRKRARTNLQLARALLPFRAHGPTSERLFEQLLAAAAPDREGFLASHQESMQAVGALTGISPDQLARSREQAFSLTDQVDEGIADVFQKMLQTLNDYPDRQAAKEYHESEFEYGRLLLQAGRREDGRPLLQTTIGLIDQALKQGEPVPDFTKLVIDGAIELCSDDPDLCQELTSLLDVAVVEVGSTSDWVKWGLKLARVYDQLGERDRARLLIQERFELAERGGDAFPDDMRDDLLEQVLSLGSGYEDLKKQALDVAAASASQAAKEIGAAAIGGLTHDLENAFRVAGLFSGSDTHLPSSLAVAAALGKCSPRWAQYAAHRLLIQAAHKPRDAALAVLATLTHALRTHVPDETFRQLASTVLGIDGYDLVTSDPESVGP